MTTTALLDAMRVGETIEDSTGQRPQLIAATVPRIRALLASGEKFDIGVDLEAFVREQSDGDCYREVIDAAERESGDGFTWKDGRPMFHGDFLNAYAHPALVYGIALGFALASDRADGEADEPRVSFSKAIANAPGSSTPPNEVLRQIAHVEHRLLLFAKVVAQGLDTDEERDALLGLMNEAGADLQTAREQLSAIAQSAEVR